MGRIAARIHSVYNFPVVWARPGARLCLSIPLNGRKDRKGWASVRFLFSNPPDLAVNIQGVYYHYEFGVETRGRDIMSRQAAVGTGLTLIFIDEDDILTDARYYCREALRYRDHSRMAGG